MSYNMNKTAVKGFLILLALICYIASGYMYSKGHDKMTNYYNSDYPSLNVNAYVGGDAYNYIINGTYSTGFYVLCAGFMIAGTVFLTGGFLAGLFNDKTQPAKEDGFTSKAKIQEVRDGE